MREIKMAVEELCLSGSISLGKCSASTLYRWCRDINTKLVKENYDWRIRVNQKDMCLEVVDDMKTKERRTNKEISEKDRELLELLEKRYARLFEQYQVPDNIRQAACLVMYRFTIDGTCDGMYICNTIAYESGSGDGQGNFMEPAKIDVRKAARAIQDAYGCNIGRGDIDELAMILDTGKLDYSVARAGMLRDMRELKQQQHTSADSWRKDYLGRQIEQKQKDFTLLIETFGKE